MRAEASSSPRPRSANRSTAGASARDTTRVVVRRAPLALARAVRGGRPLVSYLERSLPPWIDSRSSGAETKKLLRASMRGLLPDSILAARTTRTGVTGGYFGRSMREHLPMMVAAAFDHSLLEPV